MNIDKLLSRPIVYNMEDLQSLSKEELIKKLITTQNLNKFLSTRIAQPHKQVSQYLDIIPHQPPTPRY